MSKNVRRKENLILDGTLDTTNQVSLGGRGFAYAMWHFFASETNSQLVAYAGGGQANATSIGYGMSEITTATLNDSVKFPDSDAVATIGGFTVIIYNKGPAACNLYPLSGGTINNLSADAPFSVPVGRTALFFARWGTALNWSGGLLALT